MSPIAPVLAPLFAEIGQLTERWGRRVDVQALGVTDRQGHLPLGPAGLQSPNGACRLIEAADGWIALNLARDEDWDLVPAWLGLEFGATGWPEIEIAVRSRPRGGLVETAALLGLPVAAVGELVCDETRAPRLRQGLGANGLRKSPIRAIDLSALWGGPLCGGVLAAMGAAVTKVESVRRPDPTRTSTPDFFRRLNGQKSELRLDLTASADLERLKDEILIADVLITSARPRAFGALGLEPDEVFAANPGLVWVAITGYGWTAGPARVAFGDDAAAAGGLVQWTEQGAPRFLGDALADPITGLVGAVGALKALAEGGGVIVDAALARCAAGAASALRLRRAA